MATRYFGERIKRNEDPRLLMGQALYVDDVDLPNMLHAAFVRSPYAHARITNIDVSQALQRCSCHLHGERFGRLLEAWSIAGFPAARQGHCLQ